MGMYHFPMTAPDSSARPATTDAAHDSASAAPGAPKPRGYTADKDRLLKRLRRIEGQVRGVERMVDEDRYCIDVLTQISAIQAALDKVALGLTTDHAHHCVLGAAPADQPEKTDELMSAIARLMRRG